MKTVFYFTADWCNPCKKTRPIVEELNNDGFAKFQIIDSDDNIELCVKFQIRSVPTFILIEDGKEIKRLTGAQTRQSLMELIQ